jgi:hypothetical protein
MIPAVSSLPSHQIAIDFISQLLGNVQYRVRAPDTRPTTRYIAWVLRLWLTMSALVSGVRTLVQVGSRKPLTVSINFGVASDDQPGNPADYLDTDS